MATWALQRKEAASSLILCPHLPPPQERLPGPRAFPSDTLRGFPSKLTAASLGHSGLDMGPECPEVPFIPHSVIYTRAVYSTTLLTKGREGKVSIRC